MDELGVAPGNLHSHFCECGWLYLCIISVLMLFIECIYYIARMTKSTCSKAIPHMGCMVKALEKPPTRSKHKKKQIWNSNVISFPRNPGLQPSLTIRKSLSKCPWAKVRWLEPWSRLSPEVSLWVFHFPPGAPPSGTTAAFWGKRESATWSWQKRTTALGHTW